MSAPPARAPGGRPYVWSFVQQAAEQLVSFGISMFLARLLLPGDFGLVAMVSVMSGFASILLDIGLGSAIIHSEDPTQADLSTAFWTNVGIGASLTTALYLGAPYLAHFYAHGELVPIARVLAFNFSFAGLAMVDVAVLQKKLNFRLLAKTSLASSVASGVLGIGLASAGMGAMALAIQGMARAFINMALLRIVSGFSPTLTFRLTSLRAMFRYGGGMVGANIVNYWARSADNLLVGKFLGSAELGVYNRSYALMMMPMQAVSRVVSGVLFPVLTQKKGSLAELREEFLRIASRVAFATFPMMVGIGCAAEPLIRTLFGDRWLGCVWILQAFSPLGVYQTIVGLYGPIYLTLGRTDLDFKWSLVVESILILGIVIGLFAGGGVPGLIAGLYIAVLINFLPTNLVPLRLIELRLITLARSLLPAFGASLVMGAAVLAVGRALRGMVPPALLGLEVLTGIVVYIVACSVLRVQALRDARGAIARARSSPA